MPHDYERTWLSAREAARRAMQLIERSWESLERSQRILDDTDRRIWEADVIRRDAEDAPLAHDKPEP